MTEPSDQQITNATDSRYAWMLGTNHGEQGVWNHQHPTGERAAELRQQSIDTGGCGSWHPTRPNLWCTRRLRNHADRPEHICGWATWDGPFNPVRADEEHGSTPAPINRNDPAWKDTHRGLRFP